MVSLGFVDYTLEEGDDNDPYQSKIGGVPVWVSESDLIPKASELVCKVCSKRLFFVAQCNFFCFNSFNSFFCSFFISITWIY